jgi:hypothetical protein
MRSIFIAAFLFLVYSAFAAESNATAKLDGSWKWTFTMPDGSKIEPRAKLKRDGDTLTGTSRFRSGATVPIQDGKIDGDTVSWNVVREHDGRKVTTRYEGKLTGDAIKGTVSSDWAGETRSYPWEATRTSETPEGDWKWDVAFGEFRSSNTAKLKLEGKKLTGKVKSRDREYDIKDGKFESGQISFTVKRDRDGNDIVTTYRGKLDGDTIRGEMETAFGTGEPRASEWLATRVD